MKKLLVFLSCLCILSINSTIHPMEEQGGGPEFYEVTYGASNITVPIDEARKKPEDSTEFLREQLDLLLTAGKDNSEIINVLKYMLNKLFTKGGWKYDTILGIGGKRGDQKLFDDLSTWFLSLLDYANTNFSAEELYTTITILNQIFKNISNPQLTQNVSQKTFEIAQQNVEKLHEIYTLKLNELFEKNSVENLASQAIIREDSVDEDINSYEQFVNKNIKNQLITLLVEAGVFNEQNAKKAYDNTFNQIDLFKKLSPAQLKEYFNFVKEMLSVLGSNDASFEMFYQSALEANNKFKDFYSYGGFFGYGKKEFVEIPAYKVYVLAGGQSLTPQQVEMTQEELNSALTQLSVDLSALSAQLPQ